MGGATMDASAAEVAFSSHMLQARSQDGVDRAAAFDERRHALALAERFGGPQQVAEACGALCWAETVAFGAPVTAAFLLKGRATGLFPSRFLFFEALYRMELGELDAAEELFTEAVALRGTHVPHVRMGLGTLMLRRGCFEEARQHFALVLGGDRVDGLTQVRALDGQAEAERHLGEDGAATASSSRVLEQTADIETGSGGVLRRLRARAYNGLGLLRWRSGMEADALACFRSALELWPEEGRSQVAEALIALERHQVLRHAPGTAPPVEASPGHSWAIGFRMLGRGPLTPVHLPESPPSLERVQHLRDLRSGDAFEEALWPVLGQGASDAWFVSRVRSRPVARCLLVGLVPNESAAR